MKKRKKKVSKVFKRRLAIFGSISVFIILYTVGSLIFYNYKIYSLKKEQNDLNNQIVTLKKDAEEYKTTILKLQDPEYLARYARENYLYTKENELVLDLRENENELVEIKEEKTDYKFIIIGTGLIIIIMIYVITKKKKKTN